MKDRMQVTGLSLTQDTYYFDRLRSYFGDRFRASNQPVLQKHL